ncbi:Fic family protein [Eggerthella sinensis]|uniref:Fic family protein n=1 Tax=Eggerthella sinensis TaxID=242230 RepID=UPI00266D7F8A|nr:Fic family protein [Eggerthella sinensis]
MDADENRQIGQDRAPVAPGSVSGTSTYVPHAIANRAFSFRGETLATESNTEIALVRMDEMARTYPYGASLVRILNRVEAMATVRSDGVEPDLMQLLHLEFAREVGKASPREQKMYLRKVFHGSPLVTIEASYEAFCCIETLEWIERYEPKPEGIASDDVWKLYELCMRGTRKERDAGRRGSNTRSEAKSPNSGVRYMPPDYRQIDMFIDDLVEFCNRPSLTPLTRSAIAHFQLEAIKPVSEGLDRWGRMLAFLIWRQCGLMENMLPPFSLTPAVQTRKHTELLIPYQTGQDFAKRSASASLDSWVAHCARATGRSVPLAYLYRDCVTDIEADWHDRCTDMHKGSALDALLSHLVAIPIVSVPSASAITGKSYQTAAEAVARLVDLDVLTPLTEGKRNRMFVAHEAVERLSHLQTQFIPAKATTRESFFR